MFELDIFYSLGGGYNDKGDLMVIVELEEKRECLRDMPVVPSGFLSKLMGRRH